MSILTGAELGGGLPPPGTPTLIRRTDRGEESSSTAIPFSNEAAILQLTNTATRAVVQRGQELIDRRNEKNAAEKDEARKAAAEEARNRSLEEQGLKESESDEEQVVVNTVQGQAASTAQGEALNAVQGQAASTAQGEAVNAVQGQETAKGEVPEAAAAPLGTPAVVTGDAPPDGEQKTEVVDESGRLDVVA
ncbi:MAG: hypothetical protein IIB58_00325 [Planctomycetes bacterium]|nr:hypothetical protein [Planctomycetota bacterium]